MTSKHLFFKVMREDMRHRGWMIALSVLGSFLTLPVIWLIGTNNMHTYYSHYTPDVGTASYYFAYIASFWRGVANYLGGLLVIGGAMVAALAGFRFVFHKDQADTWHSLPVKRDVLFWACYVNGVVVWLLPLLISTVLTVVLSGGMALGEWGWGAEQVYEVVKLAAGNFVVWTAVFFLVYDLALLAMMFSGNVLNTMVSMLILGFGCVCLYGLGIGFCSFYFDTFFYLGFGNIMVFLYGSPFLSVITLLLERGEEIEGYSVWFNLLVAAAMAVCAWFLYRKRPSELAEQGIKSRVISTALRLVTAFGAGAGGWLLFSVITYDLVWCIFGALLAAVLVHGVLDVVFQMDFRAFFAHRLQMAATVAVTLLVCFAFYEDWFGFDKYLPEKEQIAEIGVKIESLSNRMDFSRSDLYPAAAMVYQDAETAYAFLQKMTGTYDDGWSRNESVEVRVTLKNGRTYYRRYFVGRGEREAVMPIVSSEEYMSYAYCLNESVVMEREMTLHLVRGKHSYGNKTYAEGELLDFIRAYNQDVMENAEAVLLGEGRILTEVELSFRRTDGYKATVVLTIYEFMEHTVEALKDLGYEQPVTPEKVEEIASINLSVDADDGFGVYMTAQDIIEAARAKYQVYGGDDTGGNKAHTADVSMETAEQYILSGGRTDSTLYITDQEEIKELLPLISYSDGYRRWRVFKQPFVSISITDAEGETVTCYIREGDLPEKYIQRFGELRQDMEK